MNFSNEKELYEFIRHNAKGAETMRIQLAQRMGIDGCYYEGVQWLNQFHAPLGRSGVSRLPVDWRPESNKLRSVWNETTRLTQKSMASTHPDQIYMTVEPPDRSDGPDAFNSCSVHETLVNAAIDASQYLQAAQDANNRRCVFGTWGIVLGLDVGPGGVYVCAEDFDPTCLVLEPSCQKKQLHDHPYVEYVDTWTLDRIRRRFNIDIDDNKAQTIEQLEPMKVEMSWLSNQRIFTRYARHSQAKGARVHQLHVRGEDRRFDKWFIVVEMANKDYIWVNEENTDSPFGGEVGLPMVLLHGYPRADTMWSWGEPAQIKDEQDNANLTITLHNRCLQRYAGPERAIVDRRAFAGNPTDEEIDRQFSNQVGQVVKYTGSDRARNISPPQFAPTAPVPAFLSESLQMLTGRMRDKTHKAPGNFGQNQTHVADRTVERTLDEADQVSSVRVTGDLRAHEYLISVLHGTQIKLLQEHNEPTAVMLRKEGFQPEDYAIVLQTDPYYPNVKLRVQEGSVRHRSFAAKKQDLDAAAGMQMVTPEEYKSAMADLQTPLTDQDRQMTLEARKIALAVGYGEPYMPRPSGQWGKIILDQLIRAQFDSRFSKDQGALQRLGVAIQSQYQMQYQEQLMANPELQAKLSGQGQQAPAEEQGEQGMPESVSLSDVLAGLSQQSGPSEVGRQTATA